MTDATALGFIGLGVMGEPICRNIMAKSGRPMAVFDLNGEPVARLRGEGAQAAGSPAEVARGSDIVFLSLPGGPQVEQVVLGPDGIAAHGCEGQVVVDLSTTPVGLTRDVAAVLQSKGIAFADAPVALTRRAAQDGTLSIMVGADQPTFERIAPLLAYAATDVTHCGGVGCGQVVKILNNMVLFETVVALSEALALGEAAGVERRLLFETLSKGSADSFALRNQGLKAIVPDDFPVGAYSTEYALKDVACALVLAREKGIQGLRAYQQPKSICWGL